MNDELIPIGSFVRVGGDVGVVICWPNVDRTPDEHYTIWYGMVGDDTLPVCRTVPITYCELIPKFNQYH